MLVALGIGQPAHADLIVDVTGVSGFGETAWAFSGSYSIGDVSQTSGDYSLFGVLNKISTTTSTISLMSRTS